MRDEVRVWMARPPDDRDDLVRRVLAHETGADAGSIQLDTTCRWCGDSRHGKPRALRGPPFNLAHTGGLALVAVGTAELGVDVERDTGAAVLEGSALALSAAERAAVAAVADPAVAFVRLWTRKEAYLKGTGKGLVEDPTAVEFGPSDGGWETVLRAGRPTGWVVTPLALPRGYAGALAVEGPPRAVRLAAWPPG